VESWIRRKLVIKDKRKFLADTIARITFSFTTGMVIEMSFAGMSLMKSLISRLIAQPTTAATARIYSRFRDWGLRKVGIEKKHFKNKWLNRIIFGFKYFLSNTLTYVVFYCTQYGLIRYFVVGATYEETKIATITLGASSVLLGLMYGLWLDLVRKIFKVPKQNPKNSDNKIAENLTPPDPPPTVK